MGDVCDNCPDVANPDQNDTNDSGIGDARETTLGRWADVLGSYLLEDNCPGAGQALTLAVVDGTLVLQGLPENDDIPLICEGAIAVGANVTAFGVGGHDLTLTILENMLGMLPFQPDTLGSCTSIMAPQ